MKINENNEEMILEKKDTFPKIIYHITDRFEFEYIVKKSRENIIGEYSAFKIIDNLRISKYFAKIYNGYKSNGEYFIISEYIKFDMITFYKNVDEKYYGSFWYNIFKQLAYVVWKLEEQMIQHNDFHSGNLHVSGTPKKPVIKIIDLETMVDYEHRKVYPLEVVNAENDEQERMGWSNVFHIGSDLNQIFGDLIDQYEKDIPEVIIKSVKHFIIKKDKKYPFSTNKENENMSGNNMTKIIKSLKKDIIFNI